MIVPARTAKVLARSNGAGRLVLNYTIRSGVGHSITTRALDVRDGESRGAAWERRRDAALEELGRGPKRSGDTRWSELPARVNRGPGRVVVEAERGRSRWRRTMLEIVLETGPAPVDIDVSVESEA